MENKITVIKDSLQTPVFQRWRFVPASKNILFNFKDVVSSEEEAIELVVKCYKEDMRGVRRLRSSHMTKWNWIIIEVCFLDEKARLRALKQGVTTTSGVKITPQTACIDTILYTCLTFNGLALLPTIDEIKSDIVEWSKSVIDNANDSQRYFGSNISFTADDALLVWMGVDSDGLYRGTGGVLFRGYDSKLDDRVRHQYFGLEQASTYPNVSVNVKYGYMYCDKCEILNDHESADCVANFDGCESPISGSTLTTTESPKSRKLTNY